MAEALLRPSWGSARSAVHACGQRACAFAGEMQSAPPRPEDLPAPARRSGQLQAGAQQVRLSE